MLTLEGVTAGAKIRGVAGPVAVEVVRAEWIGSDALNVVYRGADEAAEIVLFRDNEPRLELLQATRAFGFDGDADAFYRFETRLYLDDKRVLYVRGGGDPFLISEELAPLATELVAAVGKAPITGVVLDASYYPSNLRIPGIEDTGEA